jgi:hypothetical protein
MLSMDLNIRSNHEIGGQVCSFESNQIRFVGHRMVRCFFAHFDCQLSRSLSLRRTARRVITSHSLSRGVSEACLRAIYLDEVTL